MPDSATLPSKKLRNEHGRVIGRVRDRALAALIQRAPAAMQLLRAVVFIDDKRRRNAYALEYIAAQKRVLAEAEQILLAEQAKIEAKASALAQTCALFVRAAQGADDGAR